MLTKRTSKNQITLPKALLDQIPSCEYFDATVEGMALVLRPVRVVPVEEETTARKHPLNTIIGSGPGLFKTAAQVDEYLKKERQSWDG